MSDHHVALIVEDDGEMADELQQIVESIGCEAVVASNTHDALALVGSTPFCFVLLDLEIKAKPNSIKAHVENGNSLLREIRQKYPEHAGLAFALPIIIVSGFASEGSAAIDAMHDGAHYVVHKPFRSQDLSSRIRDALGRSGRATHSACRGEPSGDSNALGDVILSIPGDRIGRRTRIMVGLRAVDLPDSSLRLLLQLMVAHQKGVDVHKRDLGAPEFRGYKGVSVLGDFLRPALPEGRKIVLNKYHGVYALAPFVRIGACDVERLIALGNESIAEHARQLARPAAPTSKKSDGNS